MKNEKLIALIRERRERNRKEWEAIIEAYLFGHNFQNEADAPLIVESTNGQTCQEA